MSTTGEKAEMLMKTGRNLLSGIVRWYSLLVLVMLGSACVPVDSTASPLGTVVVGGGEAIQIRVFGALTRAGGIGRAQPAGCGAGDRGLWADQGSSGQHGRGVGFAVQRGRRCGGG